MKIISITKQALLCILFTLIMSGCVAVRPVMGSASDGAGRDSSSHTSDKKTNADYTICVDAGHGFDDIGASSDFLDEITERDINLMTANALADELRNKGFSVIMTHDGKSFPKTSVDNGDNVFKPQERIAYSTSLEVDYFISIHCDSYVADSSVHGTRIYYSKGTTTSKASAEITKAIAECITAAFPTSKECAVRNMNKADAYYVIRENTVPSSLIELGFLTNKADAENMSDPEWCSAMAAAIADGIEAFFAE